MSEWKETTLGEITTRITKGTTPTTLGFPFKEEGINFIKAEAITMDGRFIKDKFTFIDEKTNHVLRRSILEEDDILFSMAGMILGKTAVVTNDIIPANTNQALAIIRIDKSKANPWFVNYYLSEAEYFRYVNSITAQSAQPNISLSEISDLPIKLPSHKEQNEIVSILSSLDNKIDLLRRQNQTLEQLAQTIFKQWFVKEAKDEWKTAKLSDYAFINQRSIDKNYSFQEIEYLDTGSITEGIIEGFQIFNPDAAPSRAQRLVQKNDIVYSLVRPIQKHYGILKTVKPNTVVSTGFAVITCNGIDPHFIYILLTQERQIEYFETVANNSTSTYPCLKPSDIANLEFKVPPKELLIKFSDFASPTWDKISNNQKEIQTLTQLRDSLLPRLMSGRLRVG